MFNVYLANWFDESQSGSPMISTEQLIFSIPFSENEEPCMISPKIKDDMGKAPSLDFTINPGMRYYNAYQQLKTLIRIEYVREDGQNYRNTIFYGRVVTINKSNLLEIKSIHAEGMYAALADTQYEGIEEDLQSPKTAWELFSKIINDHNTMINGEYWKHITYNQSYIDANILDAESKKRESTSWLSSLDALDQLIDNYGGYMRLYYDHTVQDPNNRLKLYWHRKYYRDLGNRRPYFQLAKNIIDLSSNDEISEVFTRVIPVGHKDTNTTTSSTSTTATKQSSFVYLPNKWISVTDNSVIPSQAELEANFQSRDEFVNAEARYGIIYKTVNFQYATDTAKLSAYVTDWIKKNYFGALRSFTVKAIDMKMVNLDDDTDDMILAGDCVDISYPTFDQNGTRTMSAKTRLVCKSAQIDLFNPEQNTYTIGVPSDAIDFEYGEKSKKNNKKTASASAASADNRASGPAPTQTKNVTWLSVLHFLKRFYYTYNWGTQANAEANYAFSWRTYNKKFDVTKRADQVPYTTFEKNGELFYRASNPNLMTPPAQNPDGTQREYADDANWNTEKVEGPQYVYRNFSFNGDDLGSARVMGHYTMSPCRKMSNGFAYGVGVFESSANVFAFPWAQYNGGLGTEGRGPITINFFFPKISGSDSSESDLEPITDIDGSAANAPETEAKIWIDPETGGPSAAIFPDLGSAGFGYAKDPETGEVLEDEDGNPVWAIKLNYPITYRDENGDLQTIEAGAGGIIANELSLPGIPSFRTEVAVIREAIINRATIGHLRAFEALFGNDQEAYDENGEFIGYSGTTLQTNANNILGVSGIYAKDENGNIKTDENGNLIIKEGGVFLVEKDQTTLGLWEDGAMKAGMDVTKNNDGTYQAKLAGDYVILGNDLDHKTIEQWAEDSKSGGGVFANYFRAKRLHVDDADVENSLDVTGNMRVGSNAFITNKLTAGNMTIGIGGSLTFNGQTGASGNNTTTIDIDDAHNLMNEYSTHVKITGPVSNKYTLWYLPASKVDNSGNDPSTAAGWIYAGDFSRAASIKPIWSGSGSSGSTGLHLKLLAHPAGDETVELDSYSIGFGANYNNANDKGLVQLNTGAPEYVVSGNFRSISIPYTLDLMAPNANNPEELISSKTLYTSSKLFWLSELPITTAPTISFVKTDNDKLGAISGKATDVFGNDSASITFSVNRSTGTFQDQTGSGTTHRVMEFSYGSDVVGRYQVDDYWNSGGGSAKLVNSSNNVAASSPLTRGTTYYVAYTNAAGNLTSTGNSYSVPNSGTISLSTNNNAAHGSTMTTAINNSGFSEKNQSNYTAIFSGSIGSYNEYYAFKVSCGNATEKYYWFKTPAQPSDPHSVQTNRDVTLNPGDTETIKPTGSYNVMSQVIVRVRTGGSYSRELRLERTGAHTYYASDDYNRSRWPIDESKTVHFD